MGDLNSLEPPNSSEYLRKLIEGTETNIENLNSQINSIKTTQSTLQTLCEHPRINGILQVDDNFAFPGQVNTSGEVFLTIGDYKISLTPAQAKKHLENQRKMIEHNIELYRIQKTNFEEKLKVSEEICGQKQVGDEIRIDDRTIGRLLECGEFFEIVEFQQNDLTADLEGLKVSESKKRVSRVKNEEEKLLYLKKNK